MITQCGVGASPLGTTTDDYTNCNYASHLGSDENYGWASPSWRALFTRVAEKVTTPTGAPRILDAAPIESSWDQVACIDVVEHMSPADADKTVANSCAATDRVLSSSGRGDYAEPTHVYVRPPAHWAAARELPLASARQK